MNRSFRTANYVLCTFRVSKLLPFEVGKHVGPYWGFVNQELCYFQVTGEQKGTVLAETALGEKSTTHQEQPIDALSHDGKGKDSAENQEWEPEEAPLKGAKLLSEKNQQSQMSNEAMSAPEAETAHEKSACSPLPKLTEVGPVVCNL